jgi:hypothetical protein
MTVRPTSAGLCADCRYAHAIETRRGTTFLRCARSDVDARYRRYPALPVLDCPGHDPRPPVSGADEP